MGVPTDAELARRARAGSREAAGELFARHWQGAWRAARVITGSRAMADDVAQDAFERAFAALGRFDERRPFAAWLHRIVVNRSLDLIRRERRLVGLEEPDRVEGEWRDLAAGDRALLDAVAVLGPQRRVVIVLRYGLGYPPQDIAEMLGCRWARCTRAWRGRSTSCAASGWRRRMSRELEQRLEHALGQVESSATAEEQAWEAALGALPGGMRGRHRAVLAVAAVIVALGVAGVAMAASGTVRKVVGLSAGQPLGPVLHTPAHRSLPPGAAAFAIVAGGRALIATPHSFVRTSPLTAFELSPNGIYAGVGERGRLLAIDPANGRVVATHRVNGTVTAIAWAPIGIHIAYVVRHRGRSSLHLMDGDFTNDRVVAKGVADVRPAWRWDSLAVAFVTSGGAVQVDDLWRGAIVPVPAPADAPTEPPDQLAFAPHGSELAVRNGGAALWIADTSSHHAFFVPIPGVLGPIANAEIAWLPGNDLLETAAQFVQRVHVGRSGGTIVARSVAGSGVAGITVSPDGRTVALATFGRAVILVGVPHAPEAGYQPGDRPTALRARVVLHIFPTAVHRQVTLIWR